MHGKPASRYHGGGEHRAGDQRLTPFALQINRSIQRQISSPPGTARPGAESPEEVSIRPVGQIFLMQRENDKVKLHGAHRREKWEKVTEQLPEAVVAAGIGDDGVGGGGGTTSYVVPVAVWLSAVSGGLVGAGLAGRTVLSRRSGRTGAAAMSAEIAAADAVAAEIAAAEHAADAAAAQVTNEAAAGRVSARGRAAGRLLLRLVLDEVDLRLAGLGRGGRRDDDVLLLVRLLHQHVHERLLLVLRLQRDLRCLVGGRGRRLNEDDLVVLLRGG
uniref:Uncharacterized protein n=1 Tax=Anopheles atroparvus TaxID=41427 RepID=A0A182JKC1_ANOAO